MKQLKDNGIKALIKLVKNVDKSLTNKIDLIGGMVFCSDANLADRYLMYMNSWDALTVHVPSKFVNVDYGGFGILISIPRYPDSFTNHVNIFQTLIWNGGISYRENREGEWFNWKEDLAINGSIEMNKNSNYIRGKMADSDFWMIRGLGEADRGSLEISTHDNGDEEILVRQYTLSNVIQRELKLLDRYGDTTFPGKIYTKNGTSNITSEVVNGMNYDDYHMSRNNEFIRVLDKKSNNDGYTFMSSNNKIYHIFVNLDSTCKTTEIHFDKTLADKMYIIIKSTIKHEKNISDNIIYTFSHCIDFIDFAKVLGTNTSINKLGSVGAPTIFRLLKTCSYIDTSSSIIINPRIDNNSILSAFFEVHLIEKND